MPNHQFMVNSSNYGGGVAHSFPYWLALPQQARMNIQPYTQKFPSACQCYISVELGEAYEGGKDNIFLLGII